MEYNKYFTAIAKRQQVNPLRRISQLIKEEGLTNAIHLHAGLPNPNLFPFKRAVFELQDGTEIVLSENVMREVQQYITTKYGYQPLLNWCEKLIKEEHHPLTLGKPAEQGGLQSMIISGANDGWCAVMTALINDGDRVLVEEVTYPQTLMVLRSIGANLIPVGYDEEGMDAATLREVLATIEADDVKNDTSTMPKVLYIVPSGGNPTGITMSLRRKKEIYSIAQKYGIIILEDDPYYYLQFSRPFVPSFLSLDVDGRVVRFDSFSKIIAAGLRLGVMSGPFPIIEKARIILEPTKHPNYLAQVVCFELLDHWGIKGFTENGERIREFYKRQQESMEKVAKCHLSSVAEWAVPQAGMFYWIRLKNIQDTRKLIEDRAFKKGVTLSPGYLFAVNQQAPNPYLRASFSLASEDQMEQGFRRLAELIKEENKK